MPSLFHEILVELFRGDGKLAVELLRSCAGIAVDHAHAELGSIDLSQIAPTEYRADAVIILRDRDQQPVAGVIVEIQRQPDRGKRLTWPVYVAALRAKLDCAALLLVISPDPSVAAWARRPIELGHPGFQLTPVVIGFDDVPWIRNRSEAHELPALAVLSALAHPDLEIAEVAIDAISQLPEDQNQLYLDLIMMALPAALRQTLEARMKGYEYQSDFARKYYGQGRQEGREEGRQEGLRAAVVTLAQAKLEELSDDDVAALGAVSDQRILTELITALAQAPSGPDARTVLNRALAG
ncbi:MAG TPA: hypothetical protein VH165_12935 [Kofleriaceae bacterium]|jgi:hypothetical protein|nr:hypothetical protein [Kofleriaceae bacterium]